MRIDRRTFLRAAAGAAAGVAVSAGSPPSAEALARPHNELPWSTLGSALHGRLVLPKDASYPVDVQLYNERFDQIRPRAIAYCATPEDVQRCVDFARRHGVQVAARSGGHSYGGYSTCSGLVVDVSPMSAVRLSSDKRVATIGAGALLVDIYTRLGREGRMLPGASCPTVGIAGLTLGGGVSVFSRRYGLTCDQLEGVRMVSADGRLLHCDRQRHADLLWASQGGGGGNFGIVTDFDLRIHEVPPIALFTLQWPWAAAADVLGAWLPWVAAAPDEVWSNCQLLSAGSAGGAFSKVTGVLCGSASRMTSLLGPLRAGVGTTPTLDVVNTAAYLPAMLVEAGCASKSVAACHLPSQNPSGTLSRAAFAAKSGYLPKSPPASGIEAIVATVSSLDQDVPDVGGGVVLDAYGGAVNRVPPGATAFVHRDAVACAQWSVFWGAGAPGPVVAAGMAWLAATARRLAPYLDGAYQNYIDPTLDGWARAYYGTNLRRLVAIKRKVDPDDFFHFAQSIPTSLS